MEGGECEKWGMGIQEIGVGMRGIWERMQRMGLGMPGIWLRMQGMWGMGEIVGNHGGNAGNHGGNAGNRGGNGDK